MSLKQFIVEQRQTYSAMTGKQLEEIQAELMKKHELDEPMIDFDAHDSSEFIPSYGPAVIAGSGSRFVGLHMMGREIAVIIYSYANDGSGDYEDSTLISSTFNAHNAPDTEEGYEEALQKLKVLAR